jgi:hypothetical protein
MKIGKKYEIFLIPPWAWGCMDKIFGTYEFDPCECGCTLSWGKGYLFAFFGISIHKEWLSDETIHEWINGGQLKIKHN